MAEDTINIIAVSVRELVEFILRAGDIDSRSARMDMKAMQEGSRLHRKLQKAAGDDYMAEVSLKLETPAEYDSERFLLRVEGRADGIFTTENEECRTWIDEIKTTMRSVERMEAPVSEHRSQGMCYAYIYARQKGLGAIALRMTYCNQETEEIRYFKEVFTYEELEKWYEALVLEYAKWAAWQVKWVRRRNASIAASKFPFEYRPGQRELVANVYTTINRSKRLFIEAPTGVGKTISTVFPAVWALGEGKLSKLFYGTAKTIARTVAEDTFKILTEQGMSLKCVTITSKEKICILDKPECNPIACTRACGHFDRVNDAVYDLLTHEERIDRGLIEEYAARHNVCPFEMSLDVSTWADAVICDYNYIFDPSAHLRRFFEMEACADYGFLIDEAHNLVERARDMYSAELIKERFLEAKAGMKAATHKDAVAKDRLSRTLDACNKALLKFKRACDEFEVWEDCDTVVAAITRFAGVYEDVSKELEPAESESIRELYFDVRHFLAMHDEMDGDYRIYSDYTPDRHFRLRLQCMEPRRPLEKYLTQARSTVMFSATLLPVKYYMEQLGGRKDDYAVYAPSPFDTSRRLLMVGNDVSTRYTRRTEEEYQRIARYIEAFTSAKMGNYMVFFPSYSVMESVAQLLTGQMSGLCMQDRSMSEEEKEHFLETFETNPSETHVGFCVMGGIFAEGIDLKSDRLIGVIIVGTGLPMVCNERELFRGYFDGKNRQGFEYAYLYNGMNKVMQAAGRVIRTTQDTGAILLLDERFTNRQYLGLFPREWADYRVVNADTMAKELEEFWSRY